jgi:hypothetical protein
MYQIYPEKEKMETESTLLVRGGWEWRWTVKRQEGFNEGIHKILKLIYVDVSLSEVIYLFVFCFCGTGACRAYTLSHFTSSFWWWVFLRKGLLNYLP